MGMNLFDLFAKISLDSSEYEEGLKKSEKTGKSFASKIGNGLKTAGKIGAAAFGAITAAATATTAIMAKSISQTAEYGDNVDKMSQKMNLSATAYQEWDAIMQHSGTSIESLKAGMKTLANAVENGNDAFSRIGITQEQIASMNQEELFAATISGLQNVTDETERTYLAGQLLGRGATELGALLNMSAEETEEMRQRVHQLGGVMSDDAVKASAQFADNLQDLKTSISGIKRGITAEFLPGVNSLLAGFTSLIIGEEEAQEKLSSGLDSILTSVSTAIPRVVSVITGLGGAIIQAAPEIIKAGVQIVSAVFLGIKENAGVIIDAAFEIIDTIVDSLTDPEGLLSLVDAATEIIIKLVDGLSKALPTLLPAVVEIIMTIVEKLTEPDMLDSLVTAAISLIQALVDGIFAAQNKIIEIAPKIVFNLLEAIIRAAPRIALGAVELVVQFVSGIVGRFGKILETGRDIILQVKNGIKEKLEDAKNWGKDLIQSFVGGITEKWNALKSKVTGIADFFKGLFGHSHPEFGPMADDYKWMPDMMNLFTQGIEKNTDKLQKAAAEAFDLSDAVTMPEMSYTSPVSAKASYTTQMAKTDSDAKFDEIMGILQQYLPQLANMKMVMDTGVLVGELAPGLDAELGARQGYAMRGAAVV